MSFKDGSTHTAERIAPVNGGISCFEITASPLTDKTGKIIAGIEVVRDITDRKQAEIKLRESEEKFKSLYSSMTEGVALHEMIYDDQGKAVDYMITDTNPAYEKITSLSREQAVGSKASELYGTGNPPYFDIYEKVTSSGEPTFFETYFPPMQKHFSISVFSPGKGKFATVFDDITERKNLEERLLQSQKLEAVGRLAGGVAHDFNNMLSAIISYSHLLKQKLKEDEPLHHFVEQILNVSEKGTNIVQSLLAFSRKQVVDLKSVKLNAVIEGMKKLLEKLIGEEIELSTKLSDEDLLIKADKTQIEMVLMNLAVNARDAMPDGGILTIETKQLAMNEEYVITQGHGRSGMYAQLSVTDTGVGMDDETKKKIFEPFFTTKEVGAGTGLGLSMVYGIIEQHNGNIQVSSELGKFTTFNIYFPLISEKFEDKGIAEDLPVFHDSGTILIAEDEKEVRESLKMILEEFGFTVIEAYDGYDAIQRFIENRDNIKLLILDVIMPKMNGKEAFAEIQKMNPEIKALFMSGYTADIIRRKGIHEEGLNFINKPISPYDLQRKMIEILNN